MVKKLLLALFLLALLVGLSYVKIVRKNDQIDKAYYQGKNDSERQLSHVQLDNDSLKSIIIKQETVYKDSLSYQEHVYEIITDSLKYQIDSLKQTASDLEAKLKTTQSQLTKVNSSTKQSKLAKTISKHEQILTSYKKKYRSLPSDLSDYERKVAIAEIRAETARQYKISIAELNKLCSKNNIDF